MTDPTAAFFYFDFLAGGKLDQVSGDYIHQILGGNSHFSIFRTDIPLLPICCAPWIE
jgi:hypothetical protein